MLESELDGVTARPFVSFLLEHTCTPSLPRPPRKVDRRYSMSGPIRPLFLPRAGTLHTGTHARVPLLPYELMERILQICTDDYIYDERHDATITGHANYFLLRAALVNQTFRSIAQRLLLRHGLVDPAKALRFLYELDRKKLKETLVALRVGQLANGRDTSEADARSNSAAVSHLVKSLPTLKSLELVGERLRLGSGEFGVGLYSPTPNGSTCPPFARQC